MKRQIIHIDEEKCSGCGLCAQACHEGAIAMVDGKAKLVRENFCDGFGDCLPACPTGAITFEEREAPAYDAAAVAAASDRAARDRNGSSGGTCPGAAAATLTGGGEAAAADAAEAASASDRSAARPAAPVSRLRQWPVQIKLLPVQAPFFDGADLLIAADCTAYAYAGLHEEFMKNRITLIGCPKLDGADYSEKLTQILRANAVRSVTVVRMEVPCCGGLQRAAGQAVQNSGRDIPLQVVTISRDGRILS
ncbi:MAG: ATP-binding protein [Anaerovoracaceae bacterium]|jgi:Fe-S-cluster-containing hydrogenase component 2